MSHIPNTQKLTQKQEAFCLAFIETGVAVEAYKIAFGEKDITPARMRNQAHLCMKNEAVQKRIAELRSAAAKKTQLSLEQHLDDLKELRDLAASDGKYGPAIQAEIARGKAAGLYVEKSDVHGEIVVSWEK